MSTGSKMVKSLVSCLWIATMGYWVLLLGALLNRVYAFWGGLGAAYWALAWPSMVLALLTQLLALLGFYTAGLGLAGIACVVMVYKGHYALRVPLCVFGVSLFLAVTLGRTGMPTPRFVQALYLPWTLP